MMRDDAEEIDF